MSASRMPTFRPRSRKPEREIDRGRRFADAAFARRHRDDRGDAGNAGRRRRRPVLRRRLRRPGRRRAALRRRGGARRAGPAPPARSAVSATSTDLTPGSARTALSARCAHRLPCLTARGIDRDREKHLAVGDDDLGKFAGLRQRLTVGARNLAERCEDVVLEGAIVLLSRRLRSH